MIFNLRCHGEAMAAMGQPGMYQMGNPTGLPTGGMIIAKTEQKSWNFGIS